jgi:hypothetical protein
MKHWINGVVTFFIVLSLTLIIIPIDSFAKDEPGKKSDWVLTFKERPNLKSKGIHINPSPDQISIVDINSSIIIQVNKSLVQKKALELVGSQTPQSLIDQMDSITNILNQQATLLAMLGDGDHFSLETRKKKLARFSLEMSKLLAFLGKDPEYREKANAAFSSQSKDGKEYREVFKLVSDRMNDLKSQLNISYQRVRFRLGAFLIGKNGKHPVHISGFDKYDQGDFFQSPLFTLPTSEEVREKFQALNNAANRFNSGGVAALLNIKENLKNLDDFMTSELETGIACIKTTLDNTVSELKQKITDLPIPETRAFLAKIKDIGENIKSINELIKTIKASPADLESQLNAISRIRDLISAIKQGVKFLQNNFDTIKSELINGAKTLTDDTETIVQANLDKITTTCFAGLINFTKTIGTGIEDFFNHFNNSLLMLNEQTKSSLILGQKVSDLLIDQIPPQGVLDLEFSGRRNENDRIYIKAVLELMPTSVTSTVSSSSKSINISEKTLILYKIVAIKFSPGLIFANAFNDEKVSFTQQFQAAPSYNAVISFGNRKSLSWNRFFKMGIGINVAALDFNQDSNRELGLGVVMSALNDFLHVGVGRNMQFDEWYWFFGLKLPLLNLSFPKTSGQ